MSSSGTWPYGASMQSQELFHSLIITSSAKTILCSTITDAKVSCGMKIDCAEPRKRLPIGISPSLCFVLGDSENYDAEIRRIYRRARRAHSKGKAESCILYLCRYATKGS